MSHIHVSAFQPFESRRGVDTVLALRFRYDPELIDVLKRALQAARSIGFAYNPGGWLPEERCWFVERAAWLYVRAYLTDHGYRFSGTDDEEPRRKAGAGEPGRSLPDVRSVVKSWFHEMTLKFHPDRNVGGSDAAMKAIVHAYERLRELLGVTR
jgi:hypothetical protein